MKTEPCAGCGRILVVQPVLNLVVKCDPVPLSDVGEIVRLLTSPNPPGLWMVERNEQGHPVRLRGARPGELGPLAEHRCPVNAQEAISRPATPSVVPGARPTPHEPSAGQQTPSSGPRTAHSSARSAGPRTSNPVCNACARPMADGTYASVSVGEILVWAEHLTDCER